MRPAKLVDINRLPLDAHRGNRRRRPAPRRAGAQRRHRLPPAGARRGIPLLTRRDPGRRVAADPQHGHATAATCCSARAATTSTTSARRATSASRARGCSRDRRADAPARHPGRQRALHRHASLRHVRGAGGAGRDGARALGARRARASRSPTSTACPATARTSTRTLAPDELITHIELPPPTQLRRALAPT